MTQHIVVWCDMGICEDNTTMQWHHRGHEREQCVALICMSDVSELCDLMVTRRLKFLRRIKKVSSVVFTCIPALLSVSVVTRHIQYTKLVQCAFNNGNVCFFGPSVSPPLWSNISAAIDQKIVH